MTARIVWSKHSETEWVGHSPDLTFPRVIEYDPAFGEYFVDGNKVSYKTLRAAKIGAARTAASYEASL